jgi:hypothetical protein
MDSYRYGFQNQEKDDEVKGAGNSVNYKYRMHDTRVGRFFAVDPLASKYPWNSPYAFSENRVLDAVELEGLEALKIIAINKISTGYLIVLVPDENVENNASCPFQLTLDPNLDERFPDGIVVYSNRTTMFNFLYKGLSEKLNPELTSDGILCLDENKCWDRMDYSDGTGDNFIPTTIGFKISNLELNDTPLEGRLKESLFETIVGEEINLDKLKSVEYKFMSPDSNDGLVKYILNVTSYEAENKFEVKGIGFDIGPIEKQGDGSLVFDIPAKSEFSITVSGNSKTDDFEIKGKIETIETIKK